MSKTTKPFPRFIIGILILVFVASAVAYLSGGPASFFGHSPSEVENDFTTIVKPCNNIVTGGFYKFCKADCPNNGYYAVGGSCSTIINDFPNNDSGYRYNLSGVLPDLTSYNCFNNSYVDDGLGNEYLQAQVVCQKSGGWSAQGYQACGNYRVENSTGQPGSFDEVCDRDNFGGWLDCSDFLTQGGQPLCNGTLECVNAGANACKGFDVSSCVYCGTTPPGSCGPGLQLCQDGSCDPTCTAHGGYAGTKVGGIPTNCLPGQPCSDAPGPFTAGFCGNSILEAPELCESDADCSSYPTLDIVCPGSSSNTTMAQVCKNCGCEYDDFPCCKDAFGQPQCRTNQDCGLTPNGHPICNMGCCVNVNGN